MLDTLLWSCPICRSQDSISHQERRFRNDEVACSACHSQWDLIRVIGGPDYKMRLKNGKNGSSVKPLSEWYDQMLEGISLEPIDHPAWSQINDRRSDEVLFLISPVKFASTSPENPLLDGVDIDFPLDSPNIFGMKPIGPGDLFFTSDRLLLNTYRGVLFSHQWMDLQSVDTLMDKFLSFRFKDIDYGFALIDQSVLKWLAFTRFWINQKHNGNGYRIYQGYI